MAAVTLLAVAAGRRADIPPPVVLVVAGLIIGFLPFVPDVSLQPEVVLLGHFSAAAPRANLAGANG